MIARPRGARRARLALLAFFTLQALACSRPVDPLARGVAWLWRAQSPDGGWRSTTYGLLRSGQSQTAHVLAILLAADPAPPADRVARGLDFLEAHQAKDGIVGQKAPPVSDYPTYTTALAVRAFIAGGRPEAARRAAEALRARQFTEVLGWPVEHAAHGGWGMGDVPPQPPDPGQVDLSMTRYALEGLRASGAGDGDPAFARAAHFLARAQGPDGGFRFSPVVEGANKAGPDSYGTATADGILALLATGARPGDPRLDKARAWLLLRHALDRVPGLEGVSGWSTAMRHYYLAASARALAALGEPAAPAGTDWRAALRASLVATQRGDGSWRGDGFLMKEDDPLIATALAVQALAAAR